MIIDLKGKTALVCGSTQGIGKAIAIQLAKSGANIILMARNAEKLKSCLEALQKNEWQSHSTIQADFSDPESMNLACKKVSDLKVDILINNTGGPAAGKAIDALSSDFQKTFNAHLVNNHILVQSVVPGMKKAGFGRIINIISTSVKTPIPNLGVSNTIRGAVASWSKTLAMELAPFGITVNNILPGATETERLNEIIKNKTEKQSVSREDVEKGMIDEIPMKRFARPEEPAFAAAFLASEFSSYITGTNIVVDGGRTPCL